MVRVTCSPASRRSRKKMFKRAKGFFGDRKNHSGQTANAIMTAMSNSYKHRKLKKRDFRSLWITRIGVAAKSNGISYSRLMFGLKQAGCDLNRKMLAEMAFLDPVGFQAIAEKAKKACAG